MRAPSTTELVVSLLLLLAIVGLALAWASSRDPAAPAGAVAVQPANATRTAARQSAPRHGRRPAAPQRVQVATARSARDEPKRGHDEWRIHLTGVQPGAPWTAPLELVFEQRYRVAVDAPAAGASSPAQTPTAEEPTAFCFVPPPGARQPGIQHVTIIGRDPNYRLLRLHHRTDSLQLDGQLTASVEPVARLQGRVLGPDGRGIAARVRAFGWSKQRPQANLLGRTDSEPDGSYELKLPPKVAAILVADVVVPPLGHPLVLQPQTTLTSGWPGDMPRPTRADDIHRDDDRVIRREFLPASLVGEGTFLQPEGVPDLQVRRAAVLTGRAMTTDGLPVAFPTVTARPTASQEPSWTASPWETGLYYLAGHGVVRASVTQTRADGTFSFYAPAGIPMTISAPPTQAQSQATAPGYTELKFSNDIELQEPEPKPAPNPTHGRR